MTSLIGAHDPCLQAPDGDRQISSLRAVCLAGATAIALALALPAAAQQQAPSVEPDTLQPPAAEGTDGASGMAGGDDAAETPMTGDAPDTGTAGIAAPAEPAEPDEQPVPFDGQIIAQEEGTFAVSELVGAGVTGMDGGQIGKVDDVLMNDENQLDGLVVSAGGFLGFGAKRVGIDISRVRMVEAPTGEKTVMLDINLAELERAPEFVSLDDQRRADEEDAARQAVEREAQQRAGPTTQQQPATE